MTDVAVTFLARVREVFLSNTMPESAFLPRVFAFAFIRLEWKPGFYLDYAINASFQILSFIKRPFILSRELP
jgi:hypothetical protein